MSRRLNDISALGRFMVTPEHSGVAYPLEVGRSQLFKRVPFAREVKGFFVLALSLVVFSGICQLH